MPSKVFFNLNKEKQKRIFEAGIKEFSETVFEDFSVKNIVEDASIARGSFYAYFEDKEDFLKYIIEETKQKVLLRHIEVNNNSSDKGLFEYMKYGIVERLNDAENFTLNKDKLPVGMKLYKKLSSTEAGRSFLLNNVSHSELKTEMLKDILKNSDVGNLSQADTLLLIEVIADIGKSLYKKVMKQEITKEEAIEQLNKKFNFLEYGVKNI